MSQEGMSSGRSIRLSPARRFIADLSHAARKMPQGVITRRISIAKAAEARAKGAVKAPWTAIFVKAWAEIAAELPELRQSYVTIPWPRLYQHTTSIASVMVERELDGEKVVLPARIKSPAERSLSEVANEIRQAAEAPVETQKRNRMIMLVSRLPWPLRRFLWWFAFNTPRQRAYHAGTFGVSTIGSMGVSIYVPVSPLTTFIGYGPFAADGTVDITVGFDHRTMDGAIVAKAMAMLEDRLAKVAAEGHISQS
jgi:pyruvate/2-oxoglutarate dehydrogenase complex dihydrolipoamide acyltransferase (E2) component